MTDSATDEHDLVLLHGLQIAPRATWAQLGEVLGISGATAARRWARIAGRGDAWIAVYRSGRGNGGGALIEVDCEAPAVHDVAATLAAMPQALSVDETSGDRALLLSVATRSFGDLAGHLHAVQQVPGIRRLSSHVITSVVADASSWRLDALEAHQIRSLRRLAHRPPARLRRPDDLDHRLAVALSTDGRASATDLAHRVGVSVNTVRRRLAQLFDSGRLTARCDVARAVSGHEVAATFWLRVPAGELRPSAERIAGLPQIRLVVTVTGPHNLVVTAWLRRPADVPAFETEMAELAPAVRVGERSVTLRPVKHLGRLLDAHGHAEAVVPFDI